MTRIYTRSGDKGETGLIGGDRVQKNHPFIEAIGEVDELNAHLGVVRSLLKLDTLHGSDFIDIDIDLVQIQNLLFEVGAELAGGDEVDVEKWVVALECSIDQAEGRLPELKNFILPGGDLVAAQLHLARAVCRRLERNLVKIEAGLLITLINRLSDYLFVTARLVNARTFAGEDKWRGSAS